MIPELIDTHAHLDFPEYDSDRDTVIENARTQGIVTIINIGTGLQRSQQSVDLAARYEGVYATVGIHPHEADTFTDGQVDAVRLMARSKKVVAIGEIGLDYYKNYSRRDNQHKLFHALAGLGRELNLPLVIHTREAGADTLAVLKEAGHPAVVHCFSGDEAFLKECLELGLYISYTCNITYKKAQNLREMVKITPLDRLMLETDAPFLPPEGMRGRRNDPSFVAMLAGEVAGLKGISVEEVARATTQNARRFFRLSAES